MTQLDNSPPLVEGRTPQRRLRRSVEDRMIAGVCGGLGRYFNTDPVWFRIAFVVVTLAGGAGVLIYLIAWLLVPEARSGESVVGRFEEAQGAMMVGIVLVAIGIVLLVNTFVPWFDQVMWPLAVIAAGTGLLYLGGRREHR